jgi:hypothetical protein
LEVQDFLYAFLKEDVVAAANAHLKTEPLQQVAQPGERDIGVRST